MDFFPEDWTEIKYTLYRLTDQGKKDVVELTVDLRP